jgi:CxxC motif-containing protein
MTEIPFTCILCPNGCDLNLKAGCAKGEAYLRQERQDPRRTVLTSVLIRDGTRPVVSVKSNIPVPLPMLRPVIAELSRRSVQAPVAIGQILFPDILTTGADIIATRSIPHASRAHRILTI